MTDAAGNPTRLVGAWRRATTDACAERYPMTLTFAAGTYRGARAATQGFVTWDAGIYRLEAPGTLVMGTATDELISYRIEMHADRFDVTDGDGCRVTYRRDPLTP